MSSAAWVNTASMASPRSVCSSTIDGMSRAYAAPALIRASRAICTLPPRKWWYSDPMGAPEAWTISFIPTAP